MHVSSLLRRTLALKGHKVKKVTICGGEIKAQLEARKGSRPICSSCGRKMPGYDSLRERSWRHVPLWGIPVTLVYRPRRGKCPRCGIVVEKMSWSAGKSTLSVPLIVLLATYARILPFEEVARLFSCHWNTVRSAVASAVSFGLAHRDTGGVTAIGIDEIARRKGHRYLTMVYDLSCMRLLWCGEGRDKAALRAFFSGLSKEEKEAIRVVCCDMWQPYLDVVEEEVPGATLVFDKFHLVRHLLGAVDEVRRQEARELKVKDPEVLKRTRYIFLKNPENLTEGQRARLSDLEKLNLRINRAYLLKEAFRSLWDYRHPAWAESYLDQWVWWATRSRLKPMRDFAWLAKRHKEGILNYFRARVTNASVEGMNRKAKVVSQRAYGYKSVPTFQLALYHVLGNLPMPETTHKFL